MKENIPFSEKHPKLNFLIGLVLLFFMGYIGYITLKFLLNEFKTVIDTVSKLDAVIIVALITGSLTFITSLVSKIIDSKKSKREYLAQKREEPYANFIDMFYKIQEGTKSEELSPNHEIIKDISKINRQLTLWGSPGVVRRWIEFKKHGQKQDLNEKQLLIAFEDIMNQMRKDMGSKKTKEGELLAIIVNDANEMLRK